MKRKSANRLLVFLVSFLSIMVMIPEIVYAAQPAKSIPALTGNQRNDVVNIAESQYGYQAYRDNNIYAVEIGGKNGASWCAYFVTWCMRKARVSADVYPSYAAGSCTDLINWYKQRGRWHRVHGNTWSYNSVRDTTSTDASYVPQKGDLVLFDRDISNRNGPEHIGIVRECKNGKVYCTDGNNSDDRVGHKEYALTNNYILGYCSPAYAGDQPVNQDPIGHIDSCTADNGTITVNGWTYDPDEPDKSLAVHIYVGGSCGQPGAAGYVFIADQDGPDVNQAFHINGKHRFTATIQTDKLGNQPVYVYAINSTWGNNPEIGKSNVYMKRPCALTFDKNEIVVGENTSTKLTIKYDGEDASQMDARLVNQKDNDLARLTWGNIDATVPSIELNITGVKAGSNVIKVVLMDKNSNDLYAKTINITVSHTHKYDVEKVIKEATCSQTGTIRYACACGALSATTKTIQAKGHKYSNTWTVDQEATCKTAGSKSRHCENCDAKKDVTEIPKTAHSYKDGICSVCGEKDPAYVEKTEEEQKKNNDDDEQQEADNGNKWQDKKNEVINAAKDYLPKYFVKNGLIYQVVNKNQNKVKILACKNNQKKKVEVPDTVMISGKTYKVVEIGAKAFYGMKGLQTVVIGANIQKIGNGAFCKCKKVKDITIYSSEIKTMGKNAWKGVTKGAKVHVPAAKLKAYKRMMKKAGMSPKVLYDAR